MRSSVDISVCSPRDDVPEEDLKLSVSSRAMILNPPEWKDLWLLCRFSRCIPIGEYRNALRGGRSGARQV